VQVGNPGEVTCLGNPGFCVGALGVIQRLVKKYKYARKNPGTRTNAPSLGGN
jgi:hypothetical protein